MLKFLTLCALTSLCSLPANASSYSECEILGVIEDVYYNKVHMMVLKPEDVIQGNYDSNYQQCATLEGKVIVLYDNPKDAADEPCMLKVTADYKNKKFRNRMKDNFQKGDMVRFDYGYYSAMGENGKVMCVKDWRLKEHVPLKPHSR